MKKILITIGLILICYLGYGQYPITQNLGGPTTLVKNPNYGAVQGGLIPFTFADTTAASAALTYGKNYNGFLIWTTTPPAIWYRAYTLNKWVQLIPGADTTSVAAWSTRLNTNIPTDASLNGFFGTTAANGIGFWTNNTQRIILPAAGLTFNQVVSDTTANKVMTFNPSTKEWGYGYWFGGGGAATTPISSLTAAAASNTISNANYSQQWQWALTSGGGGLQLVNTSSTSVGNEKVLEISTTGAHASNNITTYGSYITNSHSGTGSINVAFNARAVNGDENIAAWFGRGKVRFGTTSFEKGILEILGNTSGTVTIQPAAAAGTWTMTLPTNDGDAGQYLQTNGSGVTSWATSSAGWGTTGTVATATGPMTLALAVNSFIWNDPTEGDLLSVNPSTFISTLQGSDGNYTSLISLNGNGTASNFNIFTSSGLNDVSIKGNPTTEQISLTAPQGIAFSASSSPTPDASSIVDIQSTTKGLLIPRMTETQRDAITSPATGLQIFQTDVSLGLKYYTGASWVPVGTGDFIALSGTSTLSGPTVINMGGNNIEISDASNTGVISFIPNVGQSEMVLDGSGKTFTATVANGYFFNTGNVQMNAYGAGAATFDASGNISSVSDERLKDIQGNYGVGLNQLLKVNPIVYKWKPVSKMETAHSYIGFSAQNIRDVLGGNAVGVNKEGYLSIQDRAIMAAMVNSIKELKDLNDKQQNEINDLKKALQNK